MMQSITGTIIGDSKPEMDQEVSISDSIRSATSGLAHRIFNNVSEYLRQKDQQNLPFEVSVKDFDDLIQDRTRSSLAGVLESYSKSAQNKVTATNGTDPETAAGGSDEDKARAEGYIESLAKELREDDNKSSDEDYIDDQVAELAAMALSTVILRSSPEVGLNGSNADLQHRRNIFGLNAMEEKKMTPLWKLCWEALQDFVLIMLLCLGVIGIVVETTIGLDEGEKCGSCWLEGFAILCSVCIVVAVTAGIDYSKQIAFQKLSRSLFDSNTKSVIRNGEVKMVTDADIVVGDILSVNSHSLASIPADCVLLGPAMDLKMDESALTGESLPVTKKPGDVVLSGTTAVEGSGRMIVVAVGINSVGGKIKARVYETGDGDAADDLGGDSGSPLFLKLENIAKQIGYAGTVAALLAFAVSCGIGLGYHKEKATSLIDYFIVSVTVLAVAVPEGLPLAVTLALAYSSSKMVREQNLVKHLDACETMGCATTICTDKTGTLTANQMTARSLYTAKTNYVCDDPKITLGKYILDSSIIGSVTDLITRTISICTMNETVLSIVDNKVASASGNPTELALLHLVYDLGHDYRQIRGLTRGRSDVGEVGESLHEGKLLTFSSARKMMSWAVPLENGGYRIYCKGASEVILDRCNYELSDTGDVISLTDEKDKIVKVSEQYSRRGMRCLGLAYRDLPAGSDFDLESQSVKNSDGSNALDVETDLIFCALVGMEDPLRAEVPGAISKCYQAGIDVRLVTGDSQNTAVSIAYQAGILRDSHFKPDSEKVAENLKDNVLMEGKEFRDKVYRIVEGGKKEFDQGAFDAIWPHLRVLARSSPDDKLTLAHGLNQSTLFENEAECARLLRDHDIRIFPDRQVIAMTGDGTNDAPALKRADIGFAMGVAGTQIAKDAADIILLDDNFASIVTAAKWGRNIYASIQKFLQFQLTVNIAAVVTALVGAFVYQKSPLAAIHLLWVNLLMDALASLALASEPPTDKLLMRPPVNRSDSMITHRMWANMLGQASYQIVVTMLLLFLGPIWFDLERGHKVEKRGENSVHYTFIFNTFVWMQLVNEVNSRNLKGEVNVFRGMQKNPLFIGILVATSVLQVIMVELGGVAMHVSDDGLSAKYWAISMAFGFGSLPVQQIINFIYARIVSKK